MNYKVLVTEDAETDLDNFIKYLLFVKKNEQAAENLLNDFEITKQNLSYVAGSLKDCDNPKLKKHGYKRINFTAHRYFMKMFLPNPPLETHNPYDRSSQKACHP